MHYYSEILRFLQYIHLLNLFSVDVRRGKQKSFIIFQNLEDLKSVNLDSRLKIVRDAKSASVVKFVVEITQS